jgi:hypothetical protein
MGASLLLALGRTDILSSLLLTLSEQLAWQVRSATLAAFFPAGLLGEIAPRSSSRSWAIARSARRRAHIQPTAGVE